MGTGLNNNVKSAAILINISIIVLVLSACSSSRYVPVNERNQPPQNTLSSHRVARGDTLFSIAWRYGLDYKSLARNNNIDSSYRIYPGQLLSLKAQKKSAWKPSKTTRTASKTNSANTAKKSSPVKKSTPTRSVNKSKSVKKTTSTKGYSTKFSWRWPARGALLKKYSQGSSVNKGIDISGKKGESVITAAPGRVVYSGDGLRGYGKLVIVKHNEMYLSAYAHNSRILVKEDQVVKAGQKIAEIGSSGTDKNMLHFEIRRDGKPVDPLKYLPRR